MALGADRFVARDTSHRLPRGIRSLFSGLPEAKALLQELGWMELSMGIAEELILPTIRAIENDLYPGITPTKSRIYAQLRELIEEMTVERSAELEQRLKQSTPKQPGLAIVPFMGEGDEIVVRVIARLLAAKGIDADLLSWRTLRAEKVERLQELTPLDFALRNRVEVGNERR